MYNRRVECYGESESKEGKKFPENLFSPYKLD
jgi:hypothetical protein